MVFLPLEGISKLDNTFSYIKGIYNNDNGKCFGRYNNYMLTHFNSSNLPTQLSHQ